MKLNQLTPTTITCVTILHLVALWLLAALISTPKLIPPSFTGIEFVDIPSLSDSHSIEAQSGPLAAANNEEQSKPTPNKPAIQQAKPKPVVKPDQKVIATKAETAKADVTAAETPAKEFKNTQTNTLADSSTKATETKESGSSKGTDTAGTGTNASKTGTAGQGSGKSATSATHIGGHLNNPKPVYPSTSRDNEEEGSVRMSVRVEPNGRPSSVNIAKSSGFPRLDNAARNAVSQWRFQPATRDGEPVASVYVFPVNFSLKDAR